MRLAGLVGVISAVLLHAAFILFGGLLLPKARHDQSTTRMVDLLSSPAEEKKKDQPKEDKTAETVEDKTAKPNDEAPPDAEKVVRSLIDTVPVAPALELASLGAIEAALSGKGGGEFGDALGFISGGRIDGQGTRAVAVSDKVEQSFNMAEIDQKPRAIFQSAPEYPAEMRGKKMEGVVTVLFVVDPTGKVTRQRVEKSNHAAFEKPALEAVRRWKFEPGIKAGQRVPCKMRVAVRFAAD